MKTLRSTFVSISLLCVSGCAPGFESDPNFDDAVVDAADGDEDRSAALPPLLIGAADVTDTYFGIVSAGHNTCAPGGTCIRADLIDRHGGPGGWFRVENSASWFDATDSQGIQHIEPGQPIAYQVDVDYNDWFSALTDAQQTDLAVVATLTVRPHHPMPGGATPSQVLTHAFTGATDAFHQFQLEPNWVDSDVEIRVEVTSPLIEAPVGGYVWTSTRRLRTGPSLRISPKFLPLAIVGRPPGANSWGEVRQSSNRVVKMGVTESSSQSRTTQASGGIGPIPLTDTDRVTHNRRAAEGTFQHFGHQDITSIRADSALHRHGEGDLLVVLERPDLDLWAAPDDTDFRLVDGGTLGYFPMHELVLHRDALHGSGPGSSNSFVQQLELDEVNALIDLNPVLEYPRWIPQAPRFHKLGTAVHGQGGSLHRSFSITAANIQQATSGTSTQVITDDSFSIKIPFSAIIKAIFGVSIPSELIDAYGTNTEITTTETELVRSLEILQEQGEVFAFTLSDANYDEFCAEAYWDTLFNSVIFRDCGTEPMTEGLISVYQLNDAVEFEFQLLSEEDSLLIGNFGGSDELVELIDDKTGVFYVAEVNEVGNFAIPNLAPGRYRAKQDTTGDVYTIELSEAFELLVLEGEPDDE